MAVEAAAEAVLLSWCFPWVLPKLVAIDNVEEADDNLDTSDLTIIQGKLSNCNLFQIYLKSTGKVASVPDLRLPDE